MLTQAQVQRYSNESGLRDIMIAEKEVVLTFLLQLLSERGILNRLAFKGGTSSVPVKSRSVENRPCAPMNIFRRQGRFQESE
jgi:hypothetical protein